MVSSPMLFPTSRDNTSRMLIKKLRILSSHTEDSSGKELKSIVIHSAGDLKLLSFTELSIPGSLRLLTSRSNF